MSVGRLIGAIVVILVLFAVISNPQDSAATTRNGVSTLGDAGSQVVVFLSTLVGNISSSSGGQVSSVPLGGVETGDGSTEPAG